MGMPEALVRRKRRDLRKQFQGCAIGAGSIFGQQIFHTYRREVSTVVMFSALCLDQPKW
jgi:hypothetical protein